MDVRAVAFDIDGTLYPNRRMYTHSVWFSLSRPRFLWNFGKVRRSIRNVRPIEDFRALQDSLLARAMHIPVERAHRRIDRAVYRTWQKSFRRIRPYPYVRQFIGKLKEAGFPLGVLSDFPIGQKLEYLQLADLWTCVVSSEDTGYLKPNPEPFQRLAECLGCPPEKILYIGNSYEYDILGAHRVGMATAHLARESPEQTVADLTFSDYRELEAGLLQVGAR